MTDVYIVSSVIHKDLSLFRQFLWVCVVPYSLKTKRQNPLELDWLGLEAPGQTQKFWDK